jgi:hypothetical protein
LEEFVFDHEYLLPEKQVSSDNSTVKYIIKSALGGSPTGTAPPGSISKRIPVELTVSPRGCS